MSGVEWSGVDLPIPSYFLQVLGLFRQWDEDGRGTIERAEFRCGLRALGFDMFAPKEVSKK